MEQSRGSLLQASLLRFVRRGAWSHAGRLLEKSHPADVAYVLDRVALTDREAVFALLRTPEMRGDVLSLLQFATRADLLAGLDPEVAGQIVKHMPPDDAAETLRELPQERSEEILSSLGEGAEELETLLEYPESTAGAIMSPKLLALPEDLSVESAIDHVRRYGDADASFYIYVVDERQYLVGVVSLRQLILQPPDKTLRDFMTTDPIRVTTDTDQEEVARVVSRYDILAVPVVEANNRLVGVVTVDDVIDVMRQEATEDILKLAGTTTEETTAPGWLRGAWIRLPWLVSSFVGGFAGIALLSTFSDTLTQTVQIAFFLPIILGMGGNVGNQCSTVIVRGLATGRLDVRALPRILAHEAGTSALLALTFAVALAIFAAGVGFGPELFPLAVALGIFCSIMIAASVGTLLPLFFSRVGIDPAVASGPLVTTSTDVMGILAFSLIAVTIL
jgi:magnesium transporter